MSAGNLTDETSMNSSASLLENLVAKARVARAPMRHAA